MKKRKEFIPLKHPVCSDAAAETEKKNQYFQEFGRGVQDIFLVWFGLVLKDIQKNFVFAITDGRRIYNRRKNKLQSDFQIDS